jgi:TRAP-type mannitol/chloroaromatic compound transport system substrate-binding protein
MGGWFKKEIRTLEDLRGLRMRIPGLGADVLNAFGVKTDIAINSGRVIRADEILPRLRDGRLDAAEWIGPYDDELLGLQSAARFYYAPGWWEPSTTNELMVNRRALEALSPQHRLALETACAETYLWSRREYDLRNIEALRRLRTGGVELRRFPPELMAAFAAESERLLRELERQDPLRFGYVCAEWRQFRRRIRELITITQFTPEHGAT